MNNLASILLFFLISSLVVIPVPAPAAEVLAKAAAAPAAAGGQEAWKIVDEGFHMTVPSSWKRQRGRPAELKSGVYKSKTAEMKFDEFQDLGQTVAQTQARVNALKKKAANPKLMKPGEEIWRIDGRIALFWIGRADPAQHGKLRFANVASLYVPCVEQAAYLSIRVIYRDEADLPTVRRALESIEWEKKRPLPPGAEHAR